MTDPDDFEGGFGKPKSEDDRLQAALERVGVELIEGGVGEKDGSISSR